jgi:hypothetical protein
MAVEVCYPDEIYESCVYNQVFFKKKYSWGMPPLRHNHNKKKDMIIP